MPRTKQNLYIRYRTSGGKQSPYCPAVYDNKSRLRPFVCMVNGVEERHPEGSYYLRYKKDDGKWGWKALGTDAHSAWCKSSVAASQQPLKDNRPTKGYSELSNSPGSEHGYKIAAEVETYLRNVAKLSPKTYKAYKLSLDYFQQCCDKVVYVSDITKQHLQKFDTFLREQDYSDRYRHNHVEHIVTFLRNKEGRRDGEPILNVSITVKYVERPPEAYTRKELEYLFHASSNYDKFLWRFFLGTGFREDEVAHAEFTDINTDTKMIRVDEKPYFGFKPKDYEKRSVPISDALITEIQDRTKSDSCSLIFDNEGKPDGHLLRRLKTVAFKGGLNCGRCIGTVDGQDVSCADAPVCEKWILHRFRKNFATDRHNAGASPRKIQKWLGHSSLETTLLYLAVGDDTTDEVRNIVNGVHAGL